jgi:nicotinamidase-related amidase
VPVVAAQPYPYTFERPTTALVVIDMQRDFIERGGFGEALGNDVSRLGAIVPTVKALLEWSRRHGLRVVHTREGHRPDLTDCPPAKLRRGDPSMRIDARDGPRAGRDRGLDRALRGAAEVAGHAIRSGRPPSGSGG